VDLTKFKITFSNRAYAKPWFKNLRRQNPRYFSILRAIIREIQDKGGGDIIKADLYARNPDVAALVNELGFDPVPTRGQMLKHNGNGIRHAKFAPSKSIAVVWEKIGDTIYVTFDDHAPIRYHRAISHLRDIKLGRPAFPKRPRNTGRFLRWMKKYWKDRYRKDLKGFDPKERYYE
jgi:hypothetical protein